MALRDFFRKAKRLGLDGLYQRLDRIAGEIRAIQASHGRAGGRGSIQVQIGDLQARCVRGLPDRMPLAQAEFKVFSQFGDDGIIQYILSRAPLIDYFVEFGVEDYLESNTRFLLMHDNWRGCILDGRPDLERTLRDQGLLELYALNARSAFITAENIEMLLKELEVPEEFGILSIDIDGNDYWVWSAITSFKPQVVIIEYNAVFGPDLAVSIPYASSFSRHEAHPSWLYFGASLRALVELGEKRGYAFLGCTRAGNNAYFIRRDLASPFHLPTVEEGFMDSRFRESRGVDGRMSLLSGDERRREIEHLPLVDVRTGRRLTLAHVN